MNAMEKLQAAIEKLTEFKAQPQPPFLVSFDPETMNDGDNDDTVSTAFNAGIDWGKWRERTRVADAQLAILREAIEWEESNEEPFDVNIYVALADAILGDNA